MREAIKVKSNRTGVAFPIITTIKKQTGVRYFIPTTSYKLNQVLAKSVTNGIIKVELTDDGYIYF